MAEEKRSMNPLALLVGVVAGAAGALALSDKKTRDKAQKALKNAKGEGQSLAKTTLEKIKELLADADALNKQEKIDTTAKKKAAPKKKKA